MMAATWLAVFAFASGPARAQGPDCDLGYGKSNVEATHSTQAGNHQAIRSDMWIGAPNNDCSRVSSLAVFHGSDGIVEWGWVIGHLWDTEVNGVCPTTTNWPSPERFIVWRPNNGGYHCRTEGELVSGHTSDFALKDHDSDTEWTYTFNGISQGSPVDVNFDRGIVVTNGERHKASDSAYAEFHALEWQVAGSTTWHDFDIEKQLDSDDDYNCRRVSATYAEVRMLSGNCPVP
jgi:hypothetical protein